VTGAGVQSQLSWSAGPLDNSVGDFMTFGDPLTDIQQLGSLVMTATGTAACLYVQLSEAAASGGAANPLAGFDFTAELDGVPTTLVLHLVGAETAGNVCAPVVFGDGQSFSIAVAEVGSGPQTGAYASASLSYSS
jgi:hypothetical protein